MLKKIFSVIIFSIAMNSFSSEEIKFQDILFEIPNTFMGTLTTSFSKDSIEEWGLIIASTAVLYHYDEPIYDDAQRKGRAWKLGNKDMTRSFIKAGSYDVLRLPTDTGSMLYYLGDGWLHASVGGSMVVAGKLSENSYHTSTGYMLWHGMVVSTIFNQALKRSFGRESPVVKTRERGKWTPFPSFNSYNKDTPNYDAMPSGHIMTATLTFTILSERYPEQKFWLYPLGGVWLTALGFQMVNNGVHWASDYPLGIAMGYVVGMEALKMGKNKTQTKEASWSVLPMLDGTTGLIATKEF